MTESDEPLEQRLTQDLHALVDAVSAPSDLAARARERSQYLHSAFRRRRLIAMGSLATVGVTAIFVIALTALADDGVRAVRTADEPTTTTEETTTTSTSITSSTTERVVPPPEVTATSTEPTTTTTVDAPPERRCAEATGDPRSTMTDWADYYQTEPGADRASSVRICVDDITPRVGQVVTVTLIGDDPDAVILDEECGWRVDWGEDGSLSLCRDYVLPPPDEPLPTPLPTVGRIERQSRHTYRETGTFTVAGVVISSRFTGLPHPYGSYARTELTVVAHG